MKLFLDSADYRQWPLPPGCPPVQGVTTNPTLLLQAGLAVRLDNYLGLVQKAADAGIGELMLQLPSPDVGEAASWLDALAQEAAAAKVLLTVKLPCHPDWIPAMQLARGRALPVLLTGVANPIQLLWASAHQASYVAPYIGRLQADGRDVWPFIEACVAQQPSGTQLLAASIKSADVLSRLIAAGAYAATIQPAMAAALAEDALTVAALAQFERDIAASLAR